jgi:hypothetical protein
MTDTRPGLDVRRLVTLMRAAITRCELDLRGRTVLTEAATGAYVVTPVLAAMAGAEVYALAASTDYASTPELRTATLELAESAGVAAQICLVADKSPAVVGAADIVTNSGQVRPIDGSMVASMSRSSVVPLMYESWEYRHSDIDLAACRARGIQVAGTNERHHSVDVFSFLGLMAVKQLHDAGVAVYESHLLVLCDNLFAPYIVGGLRSAGAHVTHAVELTQQALDQPRDAIVLAMQPGVGNAIAAADAQLLGERAPGSVLVQYWGDADREALAMFGVPVWPLRAPRPGHMGVLPSAIGPEPIVRLQAGGLKVGQLLAGGLSRASSSELAIVQLM